MNNLISNKSRLLTLVFLAIFPGAHHFYVGKIKNGIMMLFIAVFINLISIILMNYFGISNFVGSQKNLAMIAGLIALTILLFICTGFIIVFLFISFLYAIKLIPNSTLILNLIIKLNLNVNSLLNLTIILLWLLTICLICDLILISIGAFKDANNLPLMRKKINYELSSKSNIVAIVFCLFLGPFGAHRFYLRKYKTASMLLFCTFTPLLSTNLISVFHNIKHYHLPFILIPFAIFFILSALISIILPFIDLFWLCSGRFTDADNKLPRDYSSI